MNKSIFVIFIFFSSTIFANDNIEKCLDLDLNVLGEKVIQESKFVEIVDKSIELSTYSKKFTKENLSVDEEKNIHDGSKNYNYIFKENNDLAIFILGPEKEQGKIILSCAWIESHKFDSKLLYIGQPVSYFQKKFGLKESFEKLVVEAGSTIVELYFSKGFLYRYRYRLLDYNG